MATRRTNRADGRYIFNITVENPDGTKRRVYFSGRTQAEAKSQADAARERVAHGGPVRRDSLGQRLARRMAGNFPPGQRSSRLDEEPVRKTLRHVEPVIGQTPLGQVRPYDITRVLLAMERAGSAASTRRNVHLHLGETAVPGLLFLIAHANYKNDPT